MVLTGLGISVSVWEISGGNVPSTLFRMSPPYVCVCGIVKIGLYLCCRRELFDQPLMTQASRQMRIEAEMSRYKRVIIRVQFPDRLVMQALFRTTETGQCFVYCNCSTMLAVPI